MRPRTAARISNPSFPPLRIAAAMKTRDHFQYVNFDAIEQTVRKFAQPCAMQIFKNDRELMRIFQQTENRSLNFFAKAHPKAGAPALVPILGLHEFSPRGRRKDYLHRYGRRRANSARNCSQVTDWARSWSRVAKRLASSACCACGSGISVSARLSQSWPIKARRSSGLSRASSS